MLIFKKTVRDGLSMTILNLIGNWNYEHHSKVSKNIQNIIIVTMKHKLKTTVAKVNIIVITPMKQNYIKTT